MVKPPDQLEVLPPGQHLVDGRVLAGRSTLSRIMKFLLIWPALRSSLPDVMSFSVTTRSTGPGSLRGG
jgi:hypothetical protein